MKVEKASGISCLIDSEAHGLSLRTYYPPFFLIPTDLPKTLQQTSKFFNNPQNPLASCQPGNIFVALSPATWTWCENRSRNYPINRELRPIYVVTLEKVRTKGLESKARKTSLGLV